MKVNLTGKKVLVIGAGISGFAAAKVARKLGAAVLLSDAKAEKDIKYDFSELRACGVELAFGAQSESLLEGVSLVLVSPAVPVRVPIVAAAIKRNLDVISEVELAWRLAESPISAVTGTNGKTTTVTLLGLLLKAHYGDDKTGVGGNIGVPLVEEALRVGAGGCIAAEISSYQMEASREFHPHVAAVLNVTPDHIKRHGSMDVYQAMKERLFARQTKEDFLILNYDDPRTREMANRATNTNVFFFSRQKELSEGAFLREGALVLSYRGKEYALCPVAELGIKGAHNVENALAAASAAFFSGVAPEEMTAVLKDFRGVEHRIEPCGEIDGVAYYNDSKATNTDSAIKALETFAGHIILIAGGDDKLTDLHEFMALVKERCEELILIGAAAARFKEAALQAGLQPERIHEAGYSMEQAVRMAHELAKPPQVVLLSPACASFDMYGGFEERGRDFKGQVASLNRGGSL